MYYVTPPWSVSLRVRGSEDECNALQIGSPNSRVSSVNNTLHRWLPFACNSEFMEHALQGGDICLYADGHHGGKP